MFPFFLNQIIVGRNDNPTTEDFKRIYRQLLVCNQIVYKNDYTKSNCITDDTGVLTVSSYHEKSKVDSSTQRAVHSNITFEIEFDYFEAINEELQKFDQHLCVYTASTIESTIIANLKKSHKNKCSNCIAVFYENEKADDEIIVMKRSTNTSFKIPCLSTVHIIIASNKIFNIFENQSIESNTKKAYDGMIATIMNSLPIEELYTNSDFNTHGQINEDSSNLSHHEKFIYTVVNEYMKLKSKKIGSRISEEERGKYIRHNNKKRVHEKGQ